MATIKKTDLRPGNTVLIYGKRSTVECITDAGIMTAEGITPIENVLPIPATNDELFKLGFEYDSFINSYTLDIGNGTNQAFISLKFNYSANCHLCDCGSFKIRAKYVHDVENIINLANAHR